MSTNTKKYKYTLELACMDFKDDLKNPIPYKRTTQRAKWVSKDYQKYQAWKSFLQKEFYKKYKLMQIAKSKKKYFVSLLVYFGDKRHGDLDNIYKGVLDALFENDKFCCGEMYYFYAPVGGLSINIRQMKE